MPIASFIFGEAKQTEIDSLVVDATITATPTLTAKPTKYPVEKGSQVSDHVTVDNERLAIDGIISEYPISTLAAFTSGLATSFATDQVAQLVPGGPASGLVAGAAGVGASLAAGTVASGLQGLVSGSSAAERSDFNDTDFPNRAWQFLRALWAARTPFAIVANGTETYDNVVITNLTRDYSASVGGSLAFKMQVEKINIVTTKSGKLSEASIAASVSASAADTVDQGKQATEAATEAEAENTSILFDIFN